MLIHALKVRVLEQRRVVVVAANARDRLTLELRLREVAGQFQLDGNPGVEVLTVHDLQGFNPMNLRAWYSPAVRDAEVLWDHHTIETLYSEPLYQLYRFDKEEDNDQSASRS